MIDFAGLGWPGGNQGVIGTAIAISNIVQGFTDPLWVGTWDWAFITLTASGSAGTPTLLTITPQTTLFSDPVNFPGVATWDGLPYEPAIAGAGNPQNFPYTPTIAFGVLEDVMYRFPCFGNWMRFGFQLDAGSVTLDTVIAHRRRTAGPRG